MSRFARIITTALLVFVSFAPAATAATAATAAPAWDQKTAPVPSTEPAVDHRSPDARDAGIQAGRPESPASAAGEDSSPLVVIVGGVVVSVLLAGAMAHAAHSSRRSRRARVTA